MPIVGRDVSPLAWCMAYSFYMYIDQTPSSVFWTCRVGVTITSACPFRGSAVSCLVIQTGSKQRADRSHKKNMQRHRQEKCSAAEAFARIFQHKDNNMLMYVHPCRDVLSMPLRFLARCWNSQNIYLLIN